MREPLEAVNPATGPDSDRPEDPALLVDRMRGATLALALPMGVILGGVVLAMVAAHQIQTGGLWAPGLLAPDVQRLWAGSGHGEERGGKAGPRRLGIAASV